MSGLPTKPCVVCGRVITWRKKWERDWNSVRYCSDKCRRAKDSAARGSEGEALERAIIELLRERRPDATICPSEAARRVLPDAWRDRTEDTRAAARRLAARGEIEITQKGRPVDPSTARGPIRLRLAPRRQGQSPARRRTPSSR